MDTAVESESLLNEIFAKLKFIEQTNSEILSNCPRATLLKLEDMYGKAPYVNSLVSNHSVQSLENISFYYLNLVKNNNKEKYYKTSNVYDRVEW